ncbi:DUF3073 domain-containing protein [Agrococcus carbonis]|uniref:DUF3073 domain-containing protein n=1 Tax=Agrococcus carbonis TaxID=684552 RepID=A0A1H1N1C3_9MICO|nr:DUF3073 domain-containing protein [Agrococcus carbonis]SDR92921.1 Protein of unknown function [Agrococcus carbonis]
MGRGRQKAKHTKLARELKSFSPDINYNALQAELGSRSGDPEVDKWADYAEYQPEGDDYADEYQTGRTA